MFRKAALAPLVALGAAACTAPASGGGPRLVNRNGDQEVVYAAPRRGNVVGGAYAAVTGGSDYPVYSAAPGARTEEVGPVGTLVGGGENVQAVCTAPPAVDTATTARRGAPGGG